MKQLMVPESWLALRKPSEDNNVRVVSSLRSSRVYLRSIFPIRAEQWEASKKLRGGLALAFLLFSAGAIGNWYNLIKGNPELSIPILIACTAGSVLVLLVSPQKWDLIALCFGGCSILAAIHTILGGMKVLSGMEVIGASGVLCFTATLIKVKLRTLKLRTGGQNVSPENH